jgi:hypothetical protein
MHYNFCKVQDEQGGQMGKSYLIFGALLSTLVFCIGLSAVDDVSATMKQILDHRADDFASIRKDPHVIGDETDYSSKLMVAGAKECDITQSAKPRYADSCEIFETKSRAALTAQYKKYVKALHDASPASWISWTEAAAKPASETTYVGPDRSHPAAAVIWDLEGMNMDWYNLTVTFYADGYTVAKQ